MKMRHLAPLALVAIVALLLTGGLVWLNADDAGQPSAAKVAVLRTVMLNQSLVGTQMMGSSMEELVKGADYIAVVNVTGVGPFFNSRRAGDSMLAPPDPDQYSIAQLYEAQVERWLKGSGPATTYFTQNEGSIPPGYPKTKAAIQAGSRYVLFLNPPLQVPELNNLSWYPRAGRLPRRFALLPDGNATVDGISDPDSRIDVERRFPKGPEQALISKIETAVATTK
jgi:hypothetical protein